jgi:hypothetical protein
MFLKLDVNKRILVVGDNRDWRHNSMSQYHAIRTKQSLESTLSSRRLLVCVWVRVLGEYGRGGC